jgi:hypothetical protein
MTMMRKRRTWKDLWPLAVALVTLPALADPKAVEAFKKDIEPLLTKYCYECHGEGAKKGSVGFDQFETDEQLIAQKELWLKALKNVRAGVMPPANKPRPTEQEAAKLGQWIKYQAFAIDPEMPDPGRVTLRRLNRVEYQNTIRDLMGVEFRADEEFPPDDTGYGFDNIADVLTVSPLLLEKYMQAAEVIVSQAVPTVANVVREEVIGGNRFRKEGEKDEDKGDERDRRRGRDVGPAMSFYDAATVTHTFKASKPGSYKLTLDVTVNGAFDHDPGKANLIFKVDGKERVKKEELGWQNGQKYTFDVDEKWEPGEHKLVIELHPLTPKDQKKTSVDLRINSVRVQGPTEKEHWARPKNFERFFWKDVPAETGERLAYAKEVLAKFATRAYRRPASSQTVDRLVAIADGVWKQPGKNFEQGIAQAIVAVLASPRFMFRIEETVEKPGEKYPLIDEYALASRLSYFLWSTMPDDELLKLASRGELRKELPKQVKRMLADSRSRELMENFGGQWLQAREVEGISIDSRTVLARDQGIDKELNQLFAKFRELRAKREAESREQIKAGQPVRDRRDSTPEEQEIREKLRQFRRGPMIELDGDLRRAMRRETEMALEHIVREDRSLLELIDADYTFLNERLAKHYGIADVKGEQMRKVTLPAGHSRGGLLTQGSTLVVTSNPTRTSPVKRGLFILDNILGMPPPPPPPNLPELEESEKEFKDKEPSLREVLELHRSQPLCSSCHNRMDPLGLALENFNALGMYREKERKQPIEPAGKLITGESFTNVKELKKILVSSRRADFYRCVTEKMMTFALGRGVEYYDIETVDKIVEKLDADKGKFSVLLSGIVESSAFQRRRPADGPPVQQAQRADGR